MLDIKHLTVGFFWNPDVEFTAEILLWLTSDMQCVNGLYNSFSPSNRKYYWNDDIELRCLFLGWIMWNAEDSSLYHVISLVLIYSLSFLQVKGLFLPPPRMVKQKNRCLIYKNAAACRSVYFHLPSWSWEIMWVALIQTSTSSSSALAPWSSNQPTAPAITCPAPNHTAQRRSVFNVMLVNPIWAPLSKRDWNWILYSLKEIWVMSGFVLSFFLTPTIRLQHLTRQTRNTSKYVVWKVALMRNQTHDKTGKESHRLQSESWDISC